MSDLVYLFANKEGYLVVWRKTVQCDGNAPLEFINARFVVDTLPDEPTTSRDYYHAYPISIENMKIRAYDQARRPLRMEVLHHFPSNIELALRFENASTKELFPIEPGESARVTYIAEPTYAQWGPWLQRTVRVPTTRMGVRLFFPPNSANVHGRIIRGGTNLPLSSKLHKRRLRNWDIWYWTTTTPEFADRFRFTWTFRDRREVHAAEQFRRIHGRLSRTSTFLLSDLGRQANWFGKTIFFSAKQWNCVTLLESRLGTKFVKVKQEEALEEADAKSERIRDLFRKHPCWRTLIQCERGYVWLDPSREQFEKYLVMNTKAP